MLPDPFAAVRLEHTQLKPFDTLNDEEREETQAGIIDLYGKHAPEDVVHEYGYKQGTPSSNTVQKWRNILVTCLASTPEFQRIVMDECLTPGTHYMTTLRVRTEWLIGLYLPAFYHHFSSFEEGYTKTLKGMMEEVVHLSRSILEGIIDEKDVERLNEIASGSSDRPQIPHWGTKPAIGKLFHLAQEEKTTNFSRALTFDHLQDLGKMLEDMSGANKLHARYGKTVAGASDTLVDIFGKHALARLPNWAGLGKLNPIQVPKDFESLFMAALKDVDVADNSVDEYDAATAAVAESLPDDARIEGISRDVATFDKPMNFDRVAEDMRKTVDIGKQPYVFYPNWKTPSNKPIYFAKKPALSLSQFDSQQGEDVGSNRATTVPLHRAAGFKRARMISRDDMELDEDEAVPQSPEQVMQECHEYLDELAGDDSWHKQGFNSLFKELGTLCQRDKKAESEKFGSSEFRGFSTFIMRDNWWHARCLFHGTKLLMAQKTRPEKGKEARKIVEDAEKRVAVVLAMIGAGANDSMPWLLTMEHVQRAMWADIKTLMGSETPYELRQVFTELVLWINGTVVNAYVLRCNVHYASTADTVITKWYKLLYEYNSTCANPNCLRLLPHPDRVQPQYVRGVFSVGTRETRNGRKALRRFISTNRDNAYDCLYYVLRYILADAETVVFIFWFSHLYHNERCKFARGKHPIVAF
ncbi:hypothetical protein KC315_g3581 [Hortaea werneckii]|nr:hypothetical protein KC315_g3581 [Hortaea werneckii]